ncbi:TonB-dependent receptor plug domain-containing protein [Methylomarinum vadi]|uniref:TonB-dependent receptor plug domain-containing protein n=1 Tax=Methylomarinum vadi TaxID=438855 RepID=UPI0004DF3598|nr:TonB-dependent receptor [Methylomarinum vadi]
MISTRLKRLSCSLLLLSDCGLGYSQEALDDFFALSPAELANIPVTIATGTAKPVFRSAAVTSVITVEQITEMGATDLHEVLDTVPGLHVSKQPVTNDYVYTMRGIANTTNTEVLVMMNGSRYSLPYKGSHMQGMEIPVEAIQRIEVIRGPGSALYGADAFAGVINIITKKAADIDGVVVGGRGGSWGTRSTWGQVGKKWQGWDIAASLQYSNNGVDEDRIIKADAQTALDKIFGTKATLAPGAMQTQGERWNAHLNLQRKYIDVNFWAFSEVDAGLRAGAGGALDNRGKVNGESYLADIKLSTADALEDWEFQAHLSYLTTSIDSQIYNFPAGAVLPIGTDGNPVFAPGSSPAALVMFPDGMRTNIGIDNRMPIVELSSLYQGFNNHLIRVIAGYRYEAVVTKESRNFGVGVIDGANLLQLAFNPPTFIAGNMVKVTGTPNTFLPNRHRDIWSLALQDEWQFADGWQLTAGIRYDEYSDFGSTFNPRVALVWDINEQLTTKLLYGQAYRAPSFLEQYQQNSQFFIGNSELEPEEIETVELAFDYRPAKDLRTALNIFYYEIDNLIGNENAFTSKSTITVANGKGQQGVGSEFEWDWQFHEDWHFRGNYAWQYARNKEFNRRVSGVPEHKLYSALAWKFIPQWQLQTQLNWVGHRVSPVGDSRVLDDYETVDITLNGRKLFGHVDVTASVRNLFDSDGKEPAISAYPDSIPIPGQSFYFEAAVHF